MKIVCPHCEIQGSVDDSLAGRKLRCPKCSKVFLVADGMPPEISDSDIQSQEVIPTPEAEAAPDTFPETPVEAPEELEQTEGEEEKSPELETCFVCSQSFSTEFLVEKDAKLYCAMCEPITEEEEVAGEDEAPETIALQPCAKCGESLHPEFLDSFDGKMYCSFCLPGDDEENLELTDVSQDESDKELAFETDEAFKTVIPQPPVSTDKSDVSESVDIEEDEEGISANDSDFTVGEILKEAWQKTKGAKGTLWAAVGVMYLILIAISFGGSFGVSTILIQDAPGLAMGLNGTLQVLSSWLSLIFTAGLLLIAVHKARRQPTTWKTLFDGFSGSKIVAISIACVLQVLLIGIGFLLLIVPGIYLAIGYGLTLPLILDKGLGPWEALETSRKAIHKKWWTVFGVYVVMMLLYAVSAIPLGIGLIWTVPMFMIAIGVVYCRFFDTPGTGEQDILEMDEEEIEVESEESV